MYHELCEGLTAMTMGNQICSEPQKGLIQRFDSWRKFSKKRAVETKLQNGLQIHSLPCMKGKPGDGQQMLEPHHPCRPLRQGEGRSLGLEQVQKSSKNLHIPRAGCGANTHVGGSEPNTRRHRAAQALESLQFIVGSLNTCPNPLPTGLWPAEWLLPPVPWVWCFSAATYHSDKLILTAGSGDRSTRLSSPEIAGRMRRKDQCMERSGRELRNYTICARGTDWLLETRKIHPSLYYSGEK